MSYASGTFIILAVVMTALPNSFDPSSPEHAAGLLASAFLVIAFLFYMLRNWKDASRSEWI